MPRSRPVRRSRSSERCYKCEFSRLRRDVLGFGVGLFNQQRAATEASGLPSFWWSARASWRRPVTGTETLAMSIGRQPVPGLLEEPLPARARSLEAHHRI